MNHLAHALLAAPDDDLVFGSLIADFLRGALDPALPPGVRDGVLLHRAVDRYTDSHPDVIAARELFEPPFRRYAGILLDVWFDHLLARAWPNYGIGTLHAFSQDVQTLLQSRETEVPERMRGFVRYMQSNDLPERYREVAMVGAVLRGLSGRLTRANPLADALPVLQTLSVPLAAHFATFFPALMDFAARERARVGASSR